MPLVLLDGPGQVQRDVSQSDGLREVILDGCAAIGDTCRHGDQGEPAVVWAVSVLPGRGSLRGSTDRV